ncbi:MAG: hypothetical protein OEW73_05255 [Gammaproteobacteria bacterium]|nr:hypothetical protein [Gammaproteobacteria bacterium]MDH5240171.1 hypothetical protein [Gammaproteobacteria bacterium]MDH5261297.1 hypothetical protein [Gammaproteobacteria bacterium]
MKQIIPLLNRSPRWWPVVAAALTIALVAVSGPGFAAKGGIKGPPTGGESSNNLSLPSVQTESANSIQANWTMPVEPVLGVHYSYGCALPESDGQFNYPNTSCVDNLTNPSEYYTAEQCTDDLQPSPCQGYPVSRIYWQKVDVNEWWADDDGILQEEPNYASVSHVDWGDALEAVSWNERSVIRVETQPYSSTIPGFDPTILTCEQAAIAAGLDPATECKVGFQMWHVSGQGITEHWGVRADEAAVSFNYDSPFQIIKTINARLNLTKLEPGAATCSMPGGNPGDESPLGENGVWLGSEWADTCTYSDAPYSVETSVGGKYVYGFNWRMKNVELDSICPGYLKTGFWRLTFYAPEDVIFDDPAAPNVAPPAVPTKARTLPRTEYITELVPPVIVAPSAEDEDPTADDRLYRPVVDAVNNLTYLDICIIGKEGGGGGGGGKPGSGGKPGGGRNN